MSFPEDSGPPFGPRAFLQSWTHSMAAPAQRKASTRVKPSYFLQEEEKVVGAPHLEAGELSALIAQARRSSMCQFSETLPSWKGVRRRPQLWHPVQALATLEEQSGILSDLTLLPLHDEVLARVVVHCKDDRPHLGVGPGAVAVRCVE